MCRSTRVRRPRRVHWWRLALTRARFLVQDCWYWLTDAPMWEPPEYVQCFTARTKRDVSDEEAAKEDLGA